MKTYSFFNIAVIASTLFLFAAFFPIHAAHAQSPGVEAVKKELKKDIGMPVLDGNLWQNMTHDDKIAFIWGFWHLVSIERYLMDKYPQLRADNFSAKAVEASHRTPKTANQIVALIDSFYKTNPDDLQKPAIGILWDEMIKPNIATGIAGRSLNR